MQKINHPRGTGQHDGTAAIKPLFSPMKFKAVDGGYKHAVALDDQGTPYSWGSNEFGQLGVGLPTGSGAGTATPQRIGTFSKALSISAGSRHTLLVTDKGQLYGAGSAFNGALGNDQTTGNLTTMSPIAGASAYGPWAAVYTRSYTNLGLTSDNRLYTWGYRYGYDQGSTAVISPAPIGVFPTPRPTAFRSISAGDRFCAVVDGDGDMYLWGNNNQEQCSPAGQLTDPAPVPVQVTALPAGIAKFSMVAVGLTHGLAVDESKTSLWTWGTGYVGQLGLGSATPVTGQMQQVRLPANTVEIVKVFASINQSAALLKMSGGTLQVALWGLNDSGQTTGMGTSDDITIFTPTTPAGTLDYTQWFAMGLGYDFVLALTA